MAARDETGDDDGRGLDAAGAGTARGEAVTPRQWAALLGLSLATFVFTTSEFMPVGLLTSIASTFGMADTDASIMVSLYAWCVTLLSLPLMVAASRFGLRPLLLALVGLFSAGQLLCAVAPSFAWLVTARLLVAVAHSVFWSIVAVTATRVVAPAHASMAVGMVTGGTSVANIVGMPIGRAIGLAVGWRATFACVGAAGLVTLACLALALPALPRGERFEPGRLPALAHNRALVALYGVTVLMGSAYYCGYGLVEPFLAQVAGLPEQGVTAVLMEFGVAALVGVALFSNVYRWARVPFLSVALAAQVAALLAMTPLAGVAWGPWLDVALWGVSEACYGTAFQALLIEVVPADDATVAMAAYSGLFNLGIGGGTWLGARVAAAAGLGAIGVVGGVVGLAGLVLAVGVLFPALRRAGVLADEGGASGGGAMGGSGGEGR